MHHAYNQNGLRVICRLLRFLKVAAHNYHMLGNEVFKTWNRVLYFYLISNRLQTRKDMDISGKELNSIND